MIRNLHPNQGLCNGTRLVVTRISLHCIEDRILSGELADQLRLLSCIKLTSIDDDLPFDIS